MGCGRGKSLNSVTAAGLSGRAKFWPWFNAWGWAEEQGGFMSEGLIPSLLEPTVLQHECGNVQIPLWRSLQRSHPQIDCIPAVIRRGCWRKSDSK